jgi:hypothetical protein
MNRQELKAKFEELFRNYSTGKGDAHVREGSVIVDQVINPLTMILEPVFSDIEELVEQNNPPGAGATGDLLDSMGDRFLVSRTSGQKATADVRLLMNQKTRVSVPSGASVFAGDREFQTTRQVEFAERNFSQVTRDGQTFYESPDIPVEALEEGPEYEVAADAIRTPAFAADGLVGVYNPSPSTSAQSQEPDERFRERLRQSISSRAMDTLDGLRFLLSQQFAGDVKGLVIVEPGDPEMERDLIRTYEEVTKVGFQDKIKGSSSPNASQLFFRTTRNKLEAPTSFSREASQGEYASVTTTSANALSVDTNILYRDDFTRSRAFQTAIGDGWIAGNTGEAWKDKDAASGIYINGGDLVFGPRNRRQKEDPALPAPNDSFPPQTLPVQTLSTTQEDKRRAQIISEILENENISTQTRKEVIEAVTEPREFPIEGYRGIENNTSPVLQRKVAQPYGFRLKGTFLTTDEENPAAFTMARTENPQEASTVGRGEPKFRWYEGYGFAIQAGDGTEPNVFVIDNAAAHRQLTVVGEEVVGSKLNFDTLSQTTMPINTETQYRYEMTVGVPADGDQAMTLSVRVWEDGGTRPSTPTVSYGAYTPENRREKLLVPSGEDITSEETNPLLATQVGLGVSATGGTEYWKFSEFTVQNIQQSYAQAMAEIDVSDVSASSAEFEVSARGKGFDGSETYGHQIYVWNVTNNQWEQTPIETASYESFSYWTSKFSVDFTGRLDGDKIRFLITSTDPHEGSVSSPVISQLDLDYIQGRSYQGEEHTGGKADAFFVQSGGDNYRPSVTRTHTVSAVDNVTALDPANFGGPVSEILNVYNGTDTSGVLLQERSEYRYFWAPDGKRGGMEETLYLGVDSSFVGNDLTVEARVHNQVSSVHDFISTSNKRKLDADILARHKTPVWLDLDMTVTSSLSPSTEEVIREFIYNREQNYIDIAAIASELIDRGVKTVDTDTATLTSRRVTDQGNLVEDVNFSQSCSRIETFIPGNITITTR